MDVIIKCIRDRIKIASMAPDA